MQYSFSQLIEIFPEAKDIAEIYELKNTIEKQIEKIESEKWYVKNKLKEEIKQCRQDLENARLLKEKINQRVIRICKLENRWFWELVRDILYIEPLTDGRERKIKSNYFKLAQLSPRKTADVKNGKITDADIARAKEVPLTNFIEVNRSGFAKCIFHTDKTNSLKVYEKTNRWWCYSCNSGTDVVDLIMKMQNINFIESVKFLLNK